MNQPVQLKMYLKNNLITFQELKDFLFQGTYWMKNYLIDANNLPAVLPDGNWKCEFIVYKKDIIFFMVNIYFKSIRSPLGLF